MRHKGDAVPGHYDRFMIHVVCPACGTDIVERYGVLRRDPRLTCSCTMQFAVYLEGSPIEMADLEWDVRKLSIGTNDNDGGQIAGDR
jgi:hypothetical protein